MSNIKYAGQPSRPGSDGFAAIPAEISCVFKFGKDNDDDDDHHPFMHCDSINEFEPLEKFHQSSENITLTTAASHAAILRIKDQLKLSSSLQVHSSDGSLISVFNSEAVPLSSPITYTNLETSFDLPVGDPSFIQQILDQTHLSPSLPELDLGDELFKDLFDGTPTFDSFTDSDFDMTIDPSLHNDNEVSLQADHEQSNNSSSTVLAESMLDDSTTSPGSFISEESVRVEKKKTTSAARKLARFGNKQVIKYSEEYHDRRVKNNEAVKKSRMKAKEKQQSSDVQMNKLSEDNRLLTDRVELLMKELQVLRSLYKELKHDTLPAKVWTTRMIDFTWHQNWTHRPSRSWRSKISIAPFSQKRANEN